MYEAVTLASRLGLLVPRNPAVTRTSSFWKALPAQVHACYPRTWSQGRRNQRALYAP